MVGKVAYGYEADLADYGRQRGMPVAMARFGLVLVLIFSALVAIGSSLLLLYGWTHNDSVFQGVSAAGADLGGLTQQQATDRIAQRIQFRRRQIKSSFHTTDRPGLFLRQHSASRYDAQRSRASASRWTFGRLVDHRAMIG